jgi:sulfopyruvate decarboxylase TPP-binding subunit
MLDGPSVVAALKRSGVTHVVWVPDSELGTWEAALTGPEGLPLVRACREGEAIAIAAGLILGGQRPVVMIQCTGLFEAGDALRNVVHDLRLPLFLVIGVRSLKAHRAGTSQDSCPIFAEPIVQAWRIPYVWLKPTSSADVLANAYAASQTERRAGAALLVE